MDKSQRGPSGWNQGNREDDSGKPQYAGKAVTRKTMNKIAVKALDNAFRSKDYHKNVKESKMKTFSAFMAESQDINEAHDVELKPHENGTHYIVHKIHPSSGIESDQLKKGEKISDSHVDDLHDMGYSVKIHKK